MTFIEATVRYVAAADPHDTRDSWRSEKRLFNVEAIRIVTRPADRSSQSGVGAVFHMREGSPPYFLVEEPYAYWSAVLTFEQPRPVG